MIVVTGAAGFIGSVLVGFLNQQGYTDLVLVDDFSNSLKEGNLIGKRFTHKVHRMQFFDWLEKHHHMVQFIFHLGARTDTTDPSKEIFETLNLSYSQKIWMACCAYGLPLVYASSAATYGNGDKGYHDATPPSELTPLNPYAWSKNEFDHWALSQQNKPFFWVGLKFFNVFGPNEYHKGRMASVVYHSFQQIQQTGAMKLFRSHKTGICDGEQKRDFVYVMDVVEVLFFFMHLRKKSGLYNLGTGQARTFLDLTKSVFRALNKSPEISFIDTPEDIRDTYQYYTQADINKLRDAGFRKPFSSLEDAVQEYASHYLSTGKFA
jgi:ADP-L-glycero-D-manno-heptose 6-epimerase